MPRAWPGGGRDGVQVWQSESAVKILLVDFEAISRYYYIT